MIDLTARIDTIWLAAMLVGCASGTLPGDDAPIDVEIEVVANPHNGTVVTLAWDGDVCPGAKPLVSLEPDKGEAVPSEISASQVVILGLPPYAEIDFIVDLEVDGHVCGTGTGTFTTLSGTAGVPDVSVWTDDGTTRGWLMTSLLTPPSGPAMLDTAGNVVWFWSEATAAPVTRALLARDRASVIYGAWLGNPDTPQQAVNELVRVSIDGQHEERYRTRKMHHDFVERADGVIAYLGTREVMPVGTSETWTGDLIVELNPDGTDRVVWDAWDLFTYTDWVAPDDAAQQDLKEWTHGNAIQYSPEENAYYVSFRWRSCIVKVDATTGQTLWVFGGDESTFQLLDGTWPSDQHQFRVSDGRLLVFDNGSMTALDSRVVEYSIDEAAGTARQLWDYHADPAAYEVVLGDVERLANGNMMVAWCSFGQIDVLSPNLDLVWRTRASVGSALGYVQWLEDLAPSEL